MQTTVDIDERLLHQLEQQARQQGISLGAFLEQTLRPVIQDLPSPESGALANDSTEALSDGDPFFTALEEIRATGRLPASHREVNFH